LLKDIYETARTTTALPVADGSAVVTMFRIILTEARSLIWQRGQIEELAHAILGDHTDYQRLCTIPGIVLSPPQQISRLRFHHFATVFRSIPVTLVQRRQALMTKQYPATDCHGVGDFP
jgi:hypothetical protein